MKAWYSWDLINFMTKKMGYLSYLEIGVDRGRNFSKIMIQNKVGVDPNPKIKEVLQMTSDEFFAKNTKTFDIIFVDGLHHMDQVARDIHNSLCALSSDGTIVVHDCNPQAEEYQIVPRLCNTWTGDVWKAWVVLRATRLDLEMTAIDMCRARCGCGVIRRGSQKLLNTSVLESLTWSSLEKNRSEWLNLCTPEYFRTHNS